MDRILCSSSDIELLKNILQEYSLEIYSLLKNYDFIIEKTQNKIVNVINAPSPAATSSFSIAQEIIKNLN